MGQGFSIFLSAVTREFETARDSVTNALQARGIEVKVQRSFELSDGTTLAKLHDTVRSCDRVIAVIGTYSGMFPPEGAVTDAFRAMLPKGVARASMTQWEVIFARHYRRPIYFFEAAGFEPEQAPGEDDDEGAQAAWRHWLFDKGIGQDRRQFQSADGLRAEVLERLWPKMGASRPSNLPGSIGHLFKGREAFLDSLRESFKHKRATAITGKAVHGLGGVGKTRTAIEYGHAHAADYAATFFLIGKSENDLQDSLAALTGAAVLDLPEQDVPNLEARVAAVIRWLRGNPGWFLIIDNVDDVPAASAVRKFLDQVSQAEGHILITSRVSAWAGMVEPLELDVLSVDAAKELLLESAPRRAKRDDEDAALTLLADTHLGCLSLALVQAAAYIDERHIGFGDYVALFEKAAAKLLAKLGEATMGNLAYPKPVALTWQTSFAQLGEAGRLLLDMLAWLSIEPIPRSLMEAWPGKEAIDLDEGLAELTRYSFVHWEEDGSAFTVHRLVGQVTRDNMDEAARARALELLFSWLKAANPELNAGDVRCWPQLLPLLPHALTLLERTGDLGPYPGQTHLYNEYATLLQALARYAEAEPLFRAALEIDEASFGPDYLGLPPRLNNLALLLRATNRLDEAEPLYRRALEIYERLGPDHPRLADQLSNLAALLVTTNRLGEAEPLLRRALAIDEASGESVSAYFGVHLNTLATLLQASNRKDEAEPLFRRALAIDEAIYGLDHPNVSIRLNNLAVLMQETGRLAEAEPLLRQGLAIDEANYGPDHPNVAIRLNNLAELLRTSNRWEDAEPLFRRMVLIFLRSSKASGYLLPNTVAAIRNYILALNDSGLKLESVADMIAGLMLEAGFDPRQLWPLVFRGFSGGKDQA